MVIKFMSYYFNDFYKYMMVINPHYSYLKIINLLNSL